MKRSSIAVGSGLILFTLSLEPDLCAGTNVNPAAYLAAQPKPNFYEGHHLPHLSRWGWSLSYDTRVELARNWGYALEFGGNRGIDQITKELQDTNNIESRVCALAASDPRHFPLAVLTDVIFHGPIPDDFWVRDEQDRFTDGSKTWTDPNDKKFHKVVSPEAPDSYWQKVAEGWSKPLQLIHERAPIAIVLNGGEYGVNVPGAALAAWARDPRVQAARGNRSWFEYASERKAHYEQIIAGTIRKALFDRELYVYYDTGGESHRDMGGNWKRWAYDSAVIGNISDLPSFESYFHQYNTGWKGNNDLLTQFLDSVGYNEGLGAPLSYNWVCAGWERGGTDDFADMPHYMGFLKCLYTAGMVGGSAGYFTLPKGGFDASFPTENPTQWLQQIIALAHVHALFSHLEIFLRQGDLLPGPLRHRMSTDQPADEFPTGDANVRVLARKLRGREHWLVTAWAAGGNDRDVKVEIPELGQLTVHARASAAVYHATKLDGKIKAVLLDQNGLLPSQNLSAIQLN